VQDVGTRLTVRPRISAYGYVAHEVAEVSNVTDKTTFDAPVNAAARLGLRSPWVTGKAIVLGGLLDHQRETTSGVPLPSDLPLISGLFGCQTRRVSDTELSHVPHAAGVLRKTAGWTAARSAISHRVASRSRALARLCSARPL